MSRLSNAFKSVIITEIKNTSHLVVITMIMLSVGLPSQAEGSMVCCHFLSTYLACSTVAFVLVECDIQ